MNAASKRIKENRRENERLNMADLFIKIAILTADDIWGVTERETEQFVNAFAEIVNGYGEEGGVEAVNAELKDRGISVEIKR